MQSFCALNIFFTKAGINPRKMIYFSLKGDYTKKLKRKGYVSVIILPQSNSTVETATFINTCSSRSTTLLVML